MDEFLASLRQRHPPRGSFSRTTCGPVGWRESGCGRGPRRVARTGSPALGRPHWVARAAFATLGRPPRRRRVARTGRPHRVAGRPRTSSLRLKSEDAPDISVAFSDLGRRKAPGTVSMAPVWHSEVGGSSDAAPVGWSPALVSRTGRPCRVIAPRSPSRARNLRLRPIYRAHPQIQGAGTPGG